MSNLLRQVKEGAEQAIASISQGWRELKDRACGALTQFRSGDGKSGDPGGELSSPGNWVSWPPTSARARTASSCDWKRPA